MNTGTPSQSSGGNLPWCDGPLRWAQLTFAENDPLHVDTGFWLDYFKRCHVEAVCLSTGGYIAYHPTEIPFHHRSVHLGNRDLFGEFVEGCRKLGMSVIARTDPHAIHDDDAKAHPEWVAGEADGKPRPHWSMPGAWVTCALGPYNFEFMDEVNREIVSLYGVDGIFGNRWAGHPVCYCSRCQNDFHGATGHDLPAPGVSNPEARRLYWKWRENRLFELCRHWNRSIREIRSESRFIPNSGGGALCDLDMSGLADMTPILFADKQGRSGLIPPWANGKNGKEFRAAYGHKPVGAIFSVGLEEKYRWKDSVQSAAELQVWFAEAVAHNMRPWFTKFCATLHDRRWLDAIEPLYRQHHLDARYLRNRKSLARTGIVYSQQSARFFGAERAQARIEDPIRGFYQGLIEGRIPFGMVHDQLMETGHLSGYDTLILPNVTCLSDTQCSQLRAFVERGGNLIATLETSLYDEHGNRRDDFGLADLFGVSANGPLEGPINNAYLRTEHGAITDRDRSVLRGLERADRLIYGTLRVPVKPVAPFDHPPLTFVPPYPDLPMEEVYPREPSTGIPEVFLRDTGSGRIAYLPWDLDRVFWEILNADHALLLRNLVQWAANGESPVHAEGDGIVDISVWEQDSSMTVHLVNLTNPMMMKGPFREIYPVGKQHLRIRIPEGRTVNAAHLLHAGITPPWHITDGFLCLDVPEVTVHEVVAVDFN